jgi:hypothetical protein
MIKSFKVQVISSGFIKVCLDIHIELALGLWAKYESIWISLPVPYGVNITTTGWCRKFDNMIIIKQANLSIKQIVIPQFIEAVYKDPGGNLSRSLLLHIIPE